MHKSSNKVQIIGNLIMATVTLVTVLPFILLFSASFTDSTEIALNGYSFLPKTLSLEAYEYIWNERSQIFRAYFITILVTTVGTTVSLMITMMYAYALSKNYFPGKKFFTLFLVFTMLFNGGLVPTYTMYTRYLHMKNTIFALLIPSLLMGAMNVILIRSYIQNNVPASLTEAAYIDGANEYKIFGTIIFPLSKPIVVTIGMFIGVAYWNDWTNGLYYVTNNKLYSIQQLLNNMLKNIEYLSSNTLASAASNGAVNVPKSTVRMAIAVVGILPILIIYPYVQKFFVKGIALGAVKG
ncbi:MAG: carbohydrate ABC transporter permease [Lachnospiraceae bacterium]|nr:carbohydrate ABC transporter permease [Lachnospiraceae bacterium]